MQTPSADVIMRDIMDLSQNLSSPDIMQLTKKI